MQREIVNLLIEEGRLSDESGEELININISEFINVVKELGLEETEHIKGEKILDNLNTKQIGKELYIFKEVMSTNTIAKFFAENGIGNGAVIISEKQSKGKGRSGKSWESPLGGVWLSIILNPYIESAKTPIITLATGVAVAKTLERLNIPDVEIKWPNDILIHGNKVSGILTEAIAKFNAIESVIIGVGINVNMSIDKLPKSLQENATTLKIEANKELDENLVIKIFLEEFEKIFILFKNEEFEKILNKWRKRAYIIGKYIEVREPFRETYEGYVVGINKEGAIIVQKGDDTFEKVIFGECIVK